MLDKIFDINSFNIYSDNENYYFFRSLEEVDIESIKNKTIIDKNETIEKLITDREFYGETEYTKESEISLKEMFNHIKIHYNKHTNCISFSSNANVALVYGRTDFNDKYVMLKVSKKEFGHNVYEAGLYMLKEVNNKIEELINNHSLKDYDMQKYFFDAIDNCKTSEELEKIKEIFPKEYSNNVDIFEKGLIFNQTISKDFQSLNETQNFEKNKILLKLDILNQQLIPGITNRFLFQTIGNAFSSLEIIHYKDVDGKNLIEVPKEIMDVLGLIQQLPSNLENVDNLKLDLINIIQSIEYSGSFNYHDYELITNNLSIDDVYNITEGKVKYKDTINLYKNAFYLAKSKLRVENSVRVLKQLFKDDKYSNLINYIEKNTFGIEPELITKISRNYYNLSESVSLNMTGINKKLIDYINELNYDQLKEIMINPEETIKILLNEFAFSEEFVEISKEDWIANSLIDKLNWESFGVTENLSDSQRNDIIIALKENSFLDVYNELINQGVNEREIAKVLFTNLIKNKNTIDLKDTFTLEQLEWFIGYNRVKGLGLNLRTYQTEAVKNINEIYSKKQFTSVILPTGAGKSYVALEQLYEHKDEKMLYVAPNVEILNQLKSIIKKVYRPEEHLGEDIETVVSRLFPNLVLTTYQKLKNLETNELKDEFKATNGLIVFDELHRTGASEWMKQVQDLLNYQDEKTKILGITATPERDVDLKNMADYWAQQYGYTDEEILKGKHYAYNLDIRDAIKLGIIANPKVINCMYTLIKDGTMDELKLTIDDIVDENLKEEQLAKYEKLRKNIENSNGIEKIINESIKQGSKQIVFLPVNKNKNGTYEDLDGNIVDKSTAEEIIEKYQLLMRQYIFSYDYLNNENNKVNELYLKIKENIQLSEEEKDYLEQEKNKILLLTKIDIPGKSNALNTDTNLIADTIINYMHWESIDYKNQLYWIRNLTNDKVEDYSMLGSYSDKKNKKNLDSFNDSKSDKTKFMFVMNKLNEGVHVEDINGIVWLRPLDSNSRILYLQQLGRCIKSLDPNKEITEDNIPLVIDLVNNTLKVNLDKGISQYEKDLSNIMFIQDWINDNGRYPNYISEDKIEEKCVNILINIKSKYQKYLKDDSLLSLEDVKNRLLIEEILGVSSYIDLWNQDLPEKKNKIKRANGKTIEDSNFLLIVDSVARDFIEFKDEINSIDHSKLNILQWVKKIQLYCKEHNEWPKHKIKDKQISDGTTSDQLANWLKSSGHNSGNFRYVDVVDETGRSIKDVLDELKEKYWISTNERIIQKVKQIQKYCKNYGKWPTVDSINDSDSKDKKKQKKESIPLAAWLYNAGYNSNNFKYSDVVDETGRPIKAILDELKEKYWKGDSRSNEIIIQKVKQIQKYCKNYGKWPTASSINDSDSEDKKKQKKESIPLASWLYNAGYNSNNFKYSDVVDETGRPIKDILDELKEKYWKGNSHSNEIIIQKVKQIQKYCKNYGKWPARTPINDSDSEDKKKQKKESIPLAQWLDHAGYNKGNFKYSDVVDETGRPIIEILDELYAKFKLGKIKEYENAKEEFNQTSKFNEIITNSKENKNARKIS